TGSCSNWLATPSAASGPVSVPLPSTSKAAAEPDSMALSALTRLRRLCLRFPEAHEEVAWGEPTFRVRNKLFAMYASAGNHHGAGRAAVWVRAAAANQVLMVRAAPARFFVPPYVGVKGWVGVWLDGDVDWDELDGLLR